jgi:peptide/nickel transport system permease protein
VPLATQILGGLLGGAIIVEQVFSRPGLGSVALVAITNRDLPVVLGVVALSAVIFAVVAMLSEILVWMLDPRTRVKLVSS